MRDLSILYSSLMIQALFAGRKTQTRRLLKAEPERHIVEFIKVATDSKTGQGIYEMKGRDGKHVAIAAGRNFISDHYKAPYAVGDRLYAREVFSGPHAFRPRDDPPRTWPVGTPIWYWADGDPVIGDWTKPKPGMHMPRWASRIWMTVTDVRIERLCDISEADAIAEGIEPVFDDRAPGIAHWKDYETYVSKNVRHRHPHAVVPFTDPVRSYCSLWEEINGPGSWVDNPWVLAYTLEINMGNIDAEPVNALAGGVHA